MYNVTPADIEKAVADASSDAAPCSIEVRTEGGEDAAARRPRLTGPQCWALARHHLHDGSLLALPGQPRYSVVSAFFKKLFPRDFDRAVPIINHREVDALLARWDWHVARWAAGCGG
jgi:hypothetical protein